MEIATKGSDVVVHAPSREPGESWPFVVGARRSGRRPRISRTRCACRLHALVRPSLGSEDHPLALPHRQTIHYSNLPSSLILSSSGCL
jgi:hypothetical protein